MEWREAKASRPYRIVIIGLLVRKEQQEGRKMRMLAAKPQKHQPTTCTPTYYLLSHPPTKQGTAARRRSRGTSQRSYRITGTGWRRGLAAARVGGAGWRGAGCRRWRGAGWRRSNCPSVSRVVGGTESGQEQEHKRNIRNRSGTMKNSRGLADHIECQATSRSGRARTPGEH